MLVSSVLRLVTCLLGLLALLALDSADPTDPVSLYRHGNALYSAGNLAAAAQAFRDRQV